MGTQLEARQKVVLEYLHPALWRYSRLRPQYLSSCTSAKSAGPRKAVGDQGPGCRHVEDVVTAHAGEQEAHVTDNLEVHRHGAVDRGVRWRPLGFRSRLPESRPGCAAPSAKTSRASWDWPAPTPRNPTRGPKKRPLDGDSGPWAPMKRSLGASNSRWRPQASYTLNLPTSSHSMPASLASAAITPWAYSMSKTRETGSAGRGVQLGRVGLLRHQPANALQQNGQQHWALTADTPRLPGVAARASEDE